MKKIAIIEFIDEFRELVEFVNKNKFKLNDFLIVAVEPKLQAFLKKERVAYLDTLGFFDNESHKKMILATEKVLSRVREQFEFKDQRGLHNCYVNEYAHYLRLYLNHFFKMAEIIINIDRAYPGSSFYASVRNSWTDGLMFTEQERVLGTAVQRFANKQRLVFTDLSQGCMASAQNRSADKKTGLAEIFLALLSLLFLKSRKIIFIPYGGSYFKKLLEEIDQNVAGLTFVYLNSHYSYWGMLGFNLVAWFKSGLGLSKYPYYVFNLQFISVRAGSEEQKMLQSCLDSVFKLENIEFWSYEGIFCQDMIKEKVAEALEPHMAKMLTYSSKLDKLFQWCKKSMVMSYSAIGLMSVAGELARSKQKISLFISHGAHPEPVDHIHEIELLNLGRAFMLGDFSHIALSTPVQERHLHYFKARHSWVKNEEIKTGPLVFSSLQDSDRNRQRSRFGLTENDFVILHATTTKARHGERFYFLETFDELFSSLSDLVSLVEKKQNVRLVFRVHPGFFLDDEEIRSLLPVSSKLIIHREGEFSQALALADLVASYSSTAIDEALINKIPVLLYDKWARYNHFKTGVFQDKGSKDIFPVCYVNQSDKLEAAFDYLADKVRSEKKQDLDNSLYSYSQDHRKELYAFIKNTLS
jgi:hypothetical protein